MSQPRRVELTKDRVKIQDPYGYDDGYVDFFVCLEVNYDYYFGTDTDESETDWVDFYVRYNKITKKITSYYNISKPDGDWDCENDWELTDEEQSMFKELMEEFAKNEGLNSIDELVDAYLV